MYVFIVIGLWILAVVGWVLNIVAIFHSGPMAEWSGVTIVRVVGIFVAPLGAVMGWF